MSQLAIELYSGLHGWGAGLVSEGFWTVGFDIVDMGAMLATERPKGCHLVIQDVRTLHGRQFKDAAVIVASPPCTEYSYMAMPWKRAKQIERALRGQDEFPADYSGSRTIAELNALFDACFRIQREASEAASRHIPLIVENVRGAQKWVGRAKANFGSYYLWGDVGMVGRRVVGIVEGRLQFGVSVAPIKGAKVPGFGFDGESHGSFQSASVKTVGHANIRDGHGHARHLTNQRESDALKVGGFTWSDHAKPGYKPQALNGGAAAKLGVSRKAASAMIAKIPFPLAQHIARVFKSSLGSTEK